MTLRRRVVLLSACVVAVGIAAGSATTYLLVSGHLRAQLDGRLRAITSHARIEAGPHAGHAPVGNAALVSVLRSDGRFGGRALGQSGTPARIAQLTRRKLGHAIAAALSRSGGLGALPAYAQYVLADGRAEPSGPRLLLHPSPRALAVAAGTAQAAFADTTVEDIPVRVYTAGAGPGVAVQAVLPLTDVNDELSTLAVVLVAVSAAGALFAIGAGLVASRAALRPVSELADLAERIALTHELDTRVPQHTDDEVGRLGHAFNEMLAALQSATDQQRQLVADASHELRTPLTSLRMNLQLLAERASADDNESVVLCREIEAQIGELSALVSDIMDLAREGPLDHALEEIRLDQLVDEVVARAERHVSDVRIRVKSRPCTIHGDARLVARATGNLLDNAIKWNPPEVAVEVTVDAGGVTVRDHGPGIAPEDLPHVFDRFYRAPSARGLPGAGLGLAIVRKAAELHGGSATADNAPGGGTRLFVSFGAGEDVPDDAIRVSAATV
jgi:two-component system sensor histidine kinase MprB